MKFIECPTPAETAKLDTAGLRDAFLLEDLFRKGELNLVHTAVDRAIVGASGGTLNFVDTDIHPPVET